MSVKLAGSRWVPSNAMRHSRGLAAKASRTSAMLPINRMRPVRFSFTERRNPETLHQSSAFQRVRQPLGDKPAHGGDSHAGASQLFFRIEPIAKVAHTEIVSFDKYSPVYLPRLCLEVVGRRGVAPVLAIPKQIVTIMQPAA